jgi:uncharacterized protein (UPF0305 family)
MRRSRKSKAVYVATPEERERILELFRWFSKFSVYDKLRIAYRARTQAHYLKKLGREKFPEAFQH